MARTLNTTAPLSQIKPADLRTFHRALAAWYKTHGRRDLPWRNTRDPYPIWLSEVMLQQTQVATVLARFYHPFLDKFPTVESLAAAPREAVMKAWEGLGYYRRAGNLHDAAKRLSIEEGLAPYATLTPAASGSPEATHALIDRLRALPGIGKNTAHAIAAFAYHQPVAILEANVKRVVARIFALQTPSDNELWSGAETLLNKHEVFDYNQAMMDLGSLICTPKNPACSACPANSICAGRSTPERYPTPKIKKQTPTRNVTILVREDTGGRLFLEARDAALLGGLYGFPQIPISSPSPETPKSVSTSPNGRGTQVARPGTTSPTGRGLNFPLKKIQGEGGVQLGTVTHIYSHFKLIGQVLYEKLNTRTNSPDWHTRDEIAALPLSKLDHKVLALIDNSHTLKKKHAKPAPRRRSN